MWPGRTSSSAPTPPLCPAWSSSRVLPRAAADPPLRAAPRASVLPARLRAAAGARCAPAPAAKWDRCASRRRSPRPPAAIGPAAGDSPPLQRPPAPDVHERHEQQRDEDDRLDQREAPEGAQLDGDRVQEDHLGVEQDEQHRDQIEADAKTHLALDLRGQSALVWLPLLGVCPARTDDAVESRKGYAHRPPENEENERREIAAEHRGLLYHPCGRVLHSVNRLEIAGMIEPDQRPRSRSIDGPID